MSPHPKVRIVPIAKLLQDDRNANKGTSRGRKALESSLRRLGAGRSVLIDKNNRIIAGNKTIEAARKLGKTNIAVIEMDPNTLVAVQRGDLDLKKDKRAKELAIADNRVAELDLEWDPEVLASLKIDLKEFWSDNELRELLGDDEQIEAPEPQIENAAQLQKKWKTSRSQIWAIGKHRIMCGDSTSADDVKQLLGDGRANLIMVTDPPYGVHYKPSWRDKALGEANRATGSVSNDDNADWRASWALFRGDVAYVWHAGKYAAEVQDSLTASGFDIRSQIIWAKQHFVISRGDYHWQHEPCWQINNGLSQDGGRPETEKATGHGTQKPVECMARPIRNHEGDVYDPFAGSGTTICAAHALGRTCYAMELDPKYVAVTLERLSEMGLKPKRVAHA